MSGTGFVTSTETSGLRPLGTGSVSAFLRHSQMVAALQARGDGELADLFAEPVHDSDASTIDWYTTLPGSPVPLEALPPAEQDAALAATGRLVGRLEVLKASLKASDNADEQSLGNLIEVGLAVPDRSFIHVADGRPVLVCWGFQYDRPEPNRLDLRNFVPPLPESGPPGTIVVASRRRWPWAGIIALLLLAGALALLDWARILADPVLRPDTASVYVGETVDIHVLDNDSDVGPVVASMTISIAPEDGGAEVLAGGTIRYRAVRGHGEKRFAYSVDTPLNGRRSTTVTISIPNRSPVAVADDIAVMPGAVGEIDVLANDGDPDGDPLTLAVVGMPSEGVARITPQGRIRYEPRTGFRGVDRLTYTIDDGAGGTAEGRATIRVENRPPSAEADTVRILVGQAAVIPVLANDHDPDGDPLKVTSVGVASHGTATLLPNGQVRYEAKLGYRGEDTVSYTISDGFGGKAEARIQITIASDCRPLPAQATPATLALVVDLTGSMSGDRIQLARAALESFIPAAPPAVGMTLITFRNCTSIDNTPIHAADHRSDLLAVVRSMQATGLEDALAPAMRRAGDLLRAAPAGQLRMIVMTDGGNSCSDARVTARDLKSEMPDLEIQVMALGAPDSLYKDIADIGGGRVWLPQEGGSLAMTLRQMSRQELPPECGR